jgi:hypothetical protein
MLGIRFYTGPQRHSSGFLQTQKNKRVDRSLPEPRLVHEPEQPPRFHDFNEYFLTLAVWLSEWVSFNRA